MAVRIRGPKETDIIVAILEMLAYRKVFAWRVNQIGVPLPSGGFRKSPTRGVSDILGILPSGRFLAVEVKRPGCLGSKLTAEQARFLAKVNASGGLGIVATSAADAQAKIEEAG